MFIYRFQIGQLWKAGMLDIIRDTHSHVLVGNDPNTDRGILSCVQTDGQLVLSDRAVDDRVSIEVDGGVVSSLADRAVSFAGRGFPLQLLQRGQQCHSLGVT